MVRDWDRVVAVGIEQEIQELIKSEQDLVIDMI